MNTTNLFATTAVISLLAAPVMADTYTTREVIQKPSAVVTTKKTVKTTSPMEGKTVTNIVTEETPVTEIRETTTASGMPVGTEVRTTTVTTAPVQRSETVLETKEKILTPAGTRTIAFSDFDLNGDHILSRNEVGTKLFKLYDTDGNEVIDNIEFERRAVLTVLPVQKETKISFDFDGDGIIDESQVSQQTFMDSTLLTRFDQNQDGLSPHEFTRRDFMKADINNDKQVDLEEWKGSYIATIDARNESDARFNK